MRQKIGECLIQAGLISADDLSHALAEHKRTGEHVGVVLVRLNCVTERQIAETLARQLGFPYVDLTNNPPDAEAVTLIGEDVALEHACIAVSREDQQLTVAMADPLLFSLVQDLEVATGYRITPAVATRSDIMAAIAAACPGAARASVAAPTKKIADDVVPPRRSETEMSDATAGDELVDAVIGRAVRSKASDVHVEPRQEAVVIRHRVDGLLTEVATLSKRVHEPLIARLKEMAGMDVAETRVPQDGRLRMPAEDGTNVDFRVSTLRTRFGEKIVMRLLHPHKQVLALTDIGLSPVSLEALRRLLRQAHGLILVVGPRGSGRTTTLNAVLSALTSERTNAVTIEDPIEYELAGADQMQIDEQAGVTFASALRSILQQDNDVILVGELRDAETARIAMRAAQVGHLVLSTLRAAGAPECVTRLRDLAAEPSEFASALAGVVAQRLVRRLCVQCRRPYTPPPVVLRALGLSEGDAAPVSFYEPVGCDQCNHTGYRGRIGVFEVMGVGDALRRLIASTAPAGRIREQAIADGMVTLEENGLSTVKSGITSAAELLRAVATLGETRALCPDCGAPVGADFSACPSCGKRLGGACPHCGRGLQPGWNFCPYCARGLEDKKGPTRPRDRLARTGRRHPPGGNVAEFKK